MEHEPFLPIEISLLVLRYLAKIGCNETARQFFRELPALRDNIQHQNPGGSTPRGFDAPQTFGTLGDILCDYGRARLAVQKITTSMQQEWHALPWDSVSPCDSLLTQVRQISQVLGRTFSAQSRPVREFERSDRPPTPRLSITLPKSTSDAETQTVTVLCTRRVASTCTTLDLPESTRIKVSAIVTTREEQTQTDFIQEVVDVGVESCDDDEVEDPRVIQKMIYGKFLGNTTLSERIADNINKQIESQSSGEFAGEDLVKTVSDKTETEIDNFLSELLLGEKDSEGSMMYTWNPVLDFDANEQNFAASFYKPLTNDVSIVPHELQEQTKVCITTDDFPVPAPTRVHEVQTKAARKSHDSSRTPCKAVQQHRQSPNLKKPVVSENSSSQVVKSWQQLRRRSINPKVPLSVNSDKTTLPVPHSKEMLQPSEPVQKPVIKPAAKVVPVGDANQNLSSKSLQNLTPPTQTPVTGGAELSSLPAAFRDNILDKRQACDSTAIISKTSTTETSALRVEASSSTAACFTPTNEHAHDTKKATVSPMLLRLIASAQNRRLNTASKCHSTPRKSHVRTLQFTTPPGLKKATLGSSPPRTDNNAEDTRNPDHSNLSQSVPYTRKRKTDGDFSSRNGNNSEPKSKKRLEWTEEVPKAQEPGETDPEAVLVHIVEKPHPLVVVKKSVQQKRSSKKQRNGSQPTDYSEVIEKVVRSSRESEPKSAFPAKDGTSLTREKTEDTYNSNARVDQEHLPKSRSDGRRLPIIIPAEPILKRSSTSQSTRRRNSSESSRHSSKQRSDSKSSRPQPDPVARSTSYGREKRRESERYPPKRTSDCEKSRFKSNTAIQDNKPKSKEIFQQPSVPKPHEDRSRPPVPVLAEPPVKSNSQGPTYTSEISLNDRKRDHSSKSGSDDRRAQNQPPQPAVSRRDSSNKEKSRAPEREPPRQLPTAESNRSRTPITIEDNRTKSVDRFQQPLTPRFHVSGDSWDSAGDNQVSLNYENNGIYPSFLQTPLKDGPPATPGRNFSPPSEEKSRSSSIFDTPDMGVVKDQNVNHPNPGGVLNTPNPRADLYISSTTDVTDVTSTDQTQNCFVSSTGQECGNRTENLKPSLTQPSTKKGSREIVNTLNRAPIVQYNLSGRTKELTYSEQQTLCSLLEMREGLGSPNPKELVKSATVPLKTNKEANVLNAVLQNMSMEDLLSRLHGTKK